MRVLIFGAGNLLLSDEGFGVHFIRYLDRHYSFGETVELFDAGTLGIMAAHKIEEADKAIMVDVVDAAGSPGTILRFEKKDFLLNRLPLKLSPHQAGVQDMLLVSELRGRCPREITLFGIIPHSLKPGVELSDLLAAKMPELASLVIAELQEDGISVAPVGVNRVP